MTRNAVDRFQKQQGWDPSGIGPMTWDRARQPRGHAGQPPQPRSRATAGPGVKLMQHILGRAGDLGASTSLTRSAVDAFQKKQGWTPSGVGPMTWAELDKERPRVEVADRMGAMADPASPTRAVWHPSGNEQGRDRLLRRGRWRRPRTRRSRVSPTTVINCWEMVLYSAWKQGAITWS